MANLRGRATAKTVQCIFMEALDFGKCVNEAYGREVDLDFCLDGLTIDAEDYLEVLAEYFEVKEITSIHIDDYSPTGVWIAYEEKLEDIIGLD